MAGINDALVDAAMPIVRALKPREDIQRARRVEMAIAPDGTAIDNAPPFRRLTSPDGSVWRIRVSNTGVITATKEV